MEENNTENTEQPVEQENNVQETVNTREEAKPEGQVPAPEKKKEEEFSLKWHLKVLAVIYACLFVFYILLKLFLK